MYGGKFLFRNLLGYLIFGRSLPSLLCFSLYLRAISKYKPMWGFIFGGAI